MRIKTCLLPAPLPPQGFRADDFPRRRPLLSRLPETRGKLIPNEPLGEQTWVRIGGPAEVLYKPVDVDDLSFFLKNTPADIPITVIGLASNLLVRDGGVPGVVIKLGPHFSQIKVEGGTIIAGAGAVDLNVSRAAQTSGIAGLEFLSGIPGTIGGGLRMNAGAYSREFKDIVSEATLVDRDGTIHTLPRNKIGFAYRHTDVPMDSVFVSALLEGETGDPHDIQAKMDDIKTKRGQTQPIHEKTGGSTFANPENDLQQRKAWQLIDAAGCKRAWQARPRQSFREARQFPYQHRARNSRRCRTSRRGSAQARDGKIRN